MMTSVGKWGKYLYVDMDRVQVSHCRPAVNITAAEHNGRFHKALKVQRSMTVIMCTDCSHQYDFHRIPTIYFRYSVEITTRCSLVIEFIIPKFIGGSTCFERHTAHHQELQTVLAASDLYTHVTTGRCQGWVGNPFPTQSWQRLILMMGGVPLGTCWPFNPLNAELNPICYLLALLGAHHFLHVSRIRIK